ncbi:MAG: SCP2 sterol-binding domain-containing protein [Nannocystaceae bacterium]
MIKGDLDPMAAFSLGKLRIEGDMGVAMKLGGLLGG